MDVLDFPIVRLSVSPGAVSSRTALSSISSLSVVPFYPFLSISRSIAVTVDIMDISMAARRTTESKGTRGSYGCTLAHVYEVCIVLHLWIMLQPKPFCIRTQRDVT